MRIEDVDTQEKFEINKEKLEKIKEMGIGQVTSQGLLDFLQFFSLSRGKKGQKRSFRYDTTWLKEIELIIHNYDQNNKKIVELRKELGELDKEDKKLSSEKEQLIKRLDEIRDIHFANNQKANNMLLEIIPEKEKLQDELLNKIEDTTGYRNLDMWRII